MSQLEKGYGIYELPIKVTATATIIKGRRSRTVANPEPVIDQLDMVYSLDEEVEYVELSLSSDHRYLVVFSIKEGTYYVEVIDADRWTSQGAMELFPASEKMSYAWGDDGCLAVTNHQGDVAVLSRTENENDPYEVLYIGAVGKDFDNAFFNQDMVQKEHSTAKYQYGMDTGLAVAVKDGKATLVQNMLIGDTDFGLRNAALECVVIDKSGILYHGRLKSSLVDLDYDMSEKEVQAVKTAFDWFMKKGEVTAEFGQMILPVRSENWCRWQ